MVAAMGTPWTKREIDAIVEDYFDTRQPNQRAWESLRGGVQVSASCIGARRLSKRMVSALNLS